MKSYRQYQNVGIRWFPAAVNDMLVDPMVHDQQRAFRREHANTQVGVFGDPLPQIPAALTTTGA